MIKYSASGSSMIRVPLPCLVVAHAEPVCLANGICTSLASDGEHLAVQASWQVQLQLQHGLPFQPSPLLVAPTTPPKDPLLPCFCLLLLCWRRLGD